MIGFARVECLSDYDRNLNDAEMREIYLDADR